MSTELVWLTISFIAAHILHGGLLYTQRNERKNTISHHAVKNDLTFKLYIVGHIVAATSFLLFAKQFFASTLWGTGLVIIAAVGCTTDIIQAFIPAKNRAEKYHELFAYIMAFSVILIGIIAAFTVPLNPMTSLISRILAVGLGLSIPLSRLTNEKYFYRIQMISLFIFYIEMYVIYFGIR